MQAAGGPPGAQHYSCGKGPKQLKYKTELDEQLGFTLEIQITDDT